MKFCLILIATLVVSCGPTFYMTRNDKVVNTEIACPNNKKILVKYSLVNDVRDAIKTYFYYTKKSESNEKYTVLRLRDRRSFYIKIPPEVMVTCFVREVPHGAVDEDYVYVF